MYLNADKKSILDVSIVINESVATVISAPSVDVIILYGTLY